METGVRGYLYTGEISQSQKIAAVEFFRIIPWIHIPLHPASA